MRIAIFDFDGTLYNAETFTLLMNHLKEQYETRHKKFYASILLPYFSYKAKLYPEGKMKENLMQKYVNAFSGLSEQEILAFFDEAAYKMTADFKPKVVERLKQHAENDDYIMIVSGAFTPILQTAVADLPVDKIIGTNVPIIKGSFQRNRDRKSTRLNSSHVAISYAVFC